MTKANADTSYSSQFFASQADGSARSAAVVVPIVMSLVHIESVIDVGCGVAPWAAAFLDIGVPDVWGIDGDYVDHSQLRIPPGRFLARDLTKPLKFDREFDLAVCLEVAEHLPESRASGLVSDLTSLAPCVLFSAALVGQGGTSHMNEQYLSYWASLFRQHGYEGIDPIRPRVLGNDDVEWWYQQNTVMFVAPKHPLLAKGFPRAQTIVHQKLYEQLQEQLYECAHRPTLRKLAKGFPGAVRRSIRHRLGLG
jgi:SAM-dependent methyltransferase